MSINESASLPEPDATNPDHLRWAADVTERFVWAQNSGGYTAITVISEMTSEADALDAARSAEREREQRIETAAKVLAAAQPTDSSCFGDHNRSLALALDAAGLLRGGGRGE